MLSSRPTWLITCKHFLIWAKGGAMSSCKHTPGPVHKRENLSKTLKPWNLKWQLLSKHSGWAFNFHCEGLYWIFWRADMWMQWPAYIFPPAEHVKEKIHVQLPEEPGCSTAESVYYVKWQALQTHTLSDTQREMSMAIKIFQNPLRAALKGCWWLIIHLPFVCVLSSVCYLFTSQVKS